MTRKLGLKPSTPKMSKQAPIKLSKFESEKLNGSSIVNKDSDLVESPSKRDTMPYLDGEWNLESGLIGKKFMLFPS